MEFSQFGAEVVAGAFMLAVLGAVALTIAIMNAIFKQADKVRRAELARYRAAMGYTVPEDEEPRGRHQATPKQKSSAASLIESLQKERELSNA